MRRICPGCRAIYDESVLTCEKDGLPLLELSRTFARLQPDDPDTVQELDLEEESAVAPGMMVGEYMIERTIAEGGMGAIYAGIHPVISKRVAIKVINKRYAADPKAVARFVLEARSVNQIGHHNIVDIFSIGELDDRRNYMVMELLDGLSLSHILLRVQRLKAGQVLPVYEQLCDALEAAHRKGFIHRDLKPDNVIVLRRPPRPFIKILDFGLAKLRGAVVSQNTEVGTVLGTPEYMAPEQCRGAPVDARTDIYALGVMLYELLTGAKPFTDPSPLRILSMHQHKPPTPPSRLAPMSQRLEQVVLRSMAKVPADRYPSVKDFLADLRRCIPESRSWPEDLVVWDQAGPAQPPGELTMAPGDERRKNLIAAMTPISMSGEIGPISGEIEDEDNLQTLVSEPHQRQVPESISAEISEGEADPTREVPAPLDSQLSDPAVPEPALTPQAELTEVADIPESTMVDDLAPVVVVDLPVHEPRSDDTPDFADGPTGTMPPPVPAGDNGSSERGSLALERRTETAAGDAAGRLAPERPAPVVEEEDAASAAERAATIPREFASREPARSSRTPTEPPRAEGHRASHPIEPPGADPPGSDQPGRPLLRSDSGRFAVRNDSGRVVAWPAPETPRVDAPRAARQRPSAERTVAGSARKVPERSSPAGLAVVIVAAIALAALVVFVLRWLR